MFRIATLIAALTFSAAPVLAADGGQLFNMQCRVCHGGSTMGPSLAGVASGKIGASGFAYSAGLKGKDGVWTDANLDAFLKAPSAFSPGTKMLISVPSDESRAAIIGYLKTLK